MVQQYMAIHIHTYRDDTTPTIRDDVLFETGKFNMQKGILKFSFLTERKNFCIQFRKRGRGCMMMIMNMDNIFMNLV